MQAVLVKIIGHAVGRCDNHHAMIKKLFEQAAQNHRIGDVGDLHFIKTQKPRIIGQILGNWRDRVGIVL